MSKINNLNKKKKELLDKIKLAEKNKEEVNNFVQKILARYNIGEISYNKYHEIIKERFGEKTPEHWIDYYNSYIRAYKSQISFCDKQIRIKKLFKLKIMCSF